MWIQDFPILDASAAQNPDRPSTSLGNGLLGLFTHWQVPQKLWSRLKWSDLSKADKRTRLVVSQPGTYDEGTAEWKESKYGHVALARAIRELDLKTLEDETLNLECQVCPKS